MTFKADERSAEKRAWAQVSDDIKAGDNKIKIFQNVVAKPKVTLFEIGQNLLKIVIGDNSGVRAGSPTLTSALLDSLDEQIVNRSRSRETVLDQISAGFGIKKATLRACVRDLGTPHMSQKRHKLENYQFKLKKYEILKSLGLLKRFCSDVYHLRRWLALLPD